MAEELADGRVYATRAQVGALLVKNKTIIAEGYNGMPEGFPNEDVEYVDAEGNLRTSPLVIHAEANIFDKLSKNGSNAGARDATLYCSFSPCVPCALRIINNRVKRVVFRNLYRDVTCFEYLKKANIEIVHLPSRETVDVESVRASPPYFSRSWKFLAEIIARVSRRGSRAS